MHFGLWDMGDLIENGTCPIFLTSETPFVCKQFMPSDGPSRLFENSLEQLVARFCFLDVSGAIRHSVEEAYPFFRHILRGILVTFIQEFDRNLNLSVRLAGMPGNDLLLSGLVDLSDYLQRLDYEFQLSIVASLDVFVAGAASGNSMCQLRVQALAGWLLHWVV